MDDQEQRDEIEVLQSIYPNEMEILSESPWSFQLKVVADDDESKNFVALDLSVTFPLKYPTEEIPVVEISPLKGLSKKQVDELKTIITKISHDNIGTPVVFMFVDSVKEYLVDNNVEGQDGSMYADMLRRMQLKDVEIKKQELKASMKFAADNEQSNKKSMAVDLEEQERLRKRQAGTQCTVESFMAWKRSFDEEKRLELLKQGISSEVKDDRLTGKQLFLSNAVLASKAFNADGIAIENEEDDEGQDIRDFSNLGYNDKDNSSDDDSDYDPNEEYEDDEDDEEEDDDLEDEDCDDD